MKKIITLVIVMMAFTTILRAQATIDESEYEWHWVPLSKFIKYEGDDIYRKITYVDTSTPIKAIGFSKNKEGNDFLPHNIFFSEQPNGVEAGYYVANSIHFSMRMGNKKNKIDASSMAVINNMYIYYFGNNLALYLRKVHDNTILENIYLYYGKHIKTIQISPFSSWNELSTLNPPTNISVKENNKEVIDYKDEDGRIWNWQDERWSVNYSDGSYCSYDHKMSEWKICFHNGKTIEYKDHNLSIGNSFFLNRYYSSSLNDREAIDFFVKQKVSETIIPKSNQTYEITTDNNEYKTLSNQEIENLLKEYVFPFLKVDNNTRITFNERITDGTSFQTNRIGVYEKGKFMSEAEWVAAEKKAEAERVAAEKKAEAERVEKANKIRALEEENLRKQYFNNLNSIKKRYGAKFVDAAFKGNLIVGMPLDLLLESFWGDYYSESKKNPYMSGISWTVYIYKPAYGIYKVKRYYKRDESITDLYIWVENDKIIKINRGGTIRTF